MKNLKIMVTGRNKRMVNDICEHLENDRGYLPMKCAASKKALFEMTLNELPNVIIICSRYEVGDTVKIYDILRESARNGAIEIIVIANEEDRKMFMNHSDLDRFYFLARPVSLMALYKKLEELEKKIGENADAYKLEEYINERSTDGPDRRHILVIDDDPEQLMVIKEQLKEFYKVTVLNGWKNVLKVLKKNKIDLILLDYMMPEMDGPHVLQMIREYPEYVDIPVVFLTGMAEREAVLQLFVDYKPQGYVLKPSKKSEIVAKIIDVLDKEEAVKNGH